MFICRLEGTSRLKSSFVIKGWPFFKMHHWLYFQFTILLCHWQLLLLNFRKCCHVSQLATVSLTASCSCFDLVLCATEVWASRASYWKRCCMQHGTLVIVVCNQLATCREQNKVWKWNIRNQGSTLNQNLWYVVLILFSSLCWTKLILIWLVPLI